jgi:hypothetical protein
VHGILQEEGDEPRSGKGFVPRRLAAARNLWVRPPASGVSLTRASSLPSLPSVSTGLATVSFRGMNRPEHRFTEGNEGNEDQDDDGHAGSQPATAPGGFLSCAPGGTDARFRRLDDCGQSGQPPRRSGTPSRLGSRIPGQGSVGCLCWRGPRRAHEPWEEDG